MENNTNTPLVSVPRKKKPVALIIILIILFLGVAVAIYFFYLKKDEGTNIIQKIVNDAKPLNPNCKFNEPDLCKFVNNWKDVGYFTASITSTQEGKKSEMILKTIGTDKTQMTSSENGQENFNTITIGDAYYTKDYSDGKWTKTVYQKNESSAESETKKTYEFDAENDPTQYKKIGTEACGKLTCFKYQVIDPRNTDSTEYIYFDNKDYMLRKTYSESKDGSIMETELDYSKITISEPSPIKESATVPTATTSTSTNSSVSETTSSTATEATDDMGQAADAAARAYEEQLSNTPEVPAE